MSQYLGSIGYSDCRYTERKALYRHLKTNHGEADPAARLRTKKGKIITHLKFVDNRALDKRDYLVITRGDFYLFCKKKNML